MWRVAGVQESRISSQPQTRFHAILSRGSEGTSQSASQSREGRHYIAMLKGTKLLNLWYSSSTVM